MAVQLTKIIPDSAIDTQKNILNLSYSILNNTNADKIISFNMTHTQLGGSWSVELENLHNSYGFEEGDFVNVISVGGVNYKGLITSLRAGLGKSGAKLLVSGELKPVGLKYYDNLSFSSATPFIRPDGSVVPEPILPILDNHYRIIDITATQCMSVIAARSGFSIQSDAIEIDYPVFRFEVTGQNSLDAIETLAKYGASNACLRFQGSSPRVEILPWSETLQSFTYAFEDLLQDLQPQVVKSSFTDVIINPSNEITPWNSTYAGVPESLGSINFRSGQTTISDLGNNNSIYESPDWIFPKAVVGNEWVRFTAPVGEYKSKITQFFNESSMWAAVPFQLNSIELNKFTSKPVQQAANGVTYSQVDIPPANPNIIDMDLLYRWSLASKRFESQGDILPEIIAVPDTGQTSRFNQTFKIDDNGHFTSRLLGYGQPSFQPDQGLPFNAVGGVTPEYLSCDIFQDAQCTVKGFASDGSFYVGLQPYNHYIRPFRGTAYQPYVGTDVNEYLDVNPNFKIQINKDVTQYKIDTVSQQANPVLDGNQPSNVVVPEYKMTVTYKDGDTSNEANSERQASLQNLLNDISNQSAFTVVVPQSFDGSATGIGFGNKFEITSMTIVDEGDNAKLVLGTSHLPKLSSYQGTFQLARPLRDNLGNVVYEPVTNNIFLAQGTSGTISQQSRAIEGRWSLFKLTRKTYTPTVYVTVSTGEIITNYTGILTKQPQNPKNVSSGLLTDYFRSDGHVQKFALSLADYLNTRHVSFDIVVPHKGEKLPQFGDLINISGIPALNSISIGNSIRSKCLQTTLNITRTGGAKVTVRCGRAPIV